MLFNIAVSMRNGDKFNSQVEGESIEQLEKDLLGSAAIKLVWDKAFAVLSVADLSTLYVSEVVEETPTA